MPLPRAKLLRISLIFGFMWLGCQRDDPNNSPGSSDIFATSDGVLFRVETVAKNLEIPWALAFDPSGNLWFTERPGRLQMLAAGANTPKLIAKISAVAPVGEGGLMGLAFHPQVAQNGWLYLSLTYRVSGDLKNRVVRYRYSGQQLTEQTVIVDALPGGSIHDGCRIRFGPDGKLYVTTGETGQKELAQQMSSLGGKILRVNDDGSIPNDNPFPNSPIFSLGHRNPQGIDWHPTSGLCFSTEHGPSGFDAPGGGDEVNIVEAGKNYGWPVIHHQQTQPGLEAPLLEFTPAVAPSGGSFYTGNIFTNFRNNFFFACLRGQQVHRVVLDAANPRRVTSHEELLKGKFGRIRDVISGLDGTIYFCTSNQDGRGNPTSDDDRILRIVAVQ